MPDISLAFTFSDLQAQVPHEMKHMDPFVLCGLDKMKFMLQGADAHQLAMDPGKLFLDKLVVVEKDRAGG